MWWVLLVWQIQYCFVHVVKRFQAVKQCSNLSVCPLICTFCTCFPDEVCGVHTKQQHHRRPLSGVRQPEGAATSGFHSGLAQLAHRLPHLCCLPSCGWCLQVHIGEHKRKITVFYIIWHPLKINVMLSQNLIIIDWSFFLLNSPP